MRDKLTKIFKACFKKHVGVDDFGCDGCNQYVEQTLALFQKLVASKKNMPELMLSEYGKGQNDLVDDLLSEIGK